jgi:2-formylbenzoate dehydrogenase
MTTGTEQAAAAVGARDWRLLIGGELVPARSGRTYRTDDPSTELPLAEVPDGDAGDVEAAHRAADAARAGWAATAPVERGRLVRRLAAAVREHADELATLDALDLGSPHRQLLLDVERAAESLDTFANWALNLTGEVIPASGRHLHFTLRQPYGVVGRIIPFNHQLQFAAGKIAAPLVAGNTVIVKPAHQTPLSALRMGELFAELLPAGVLNIVTGAGPEPGVAIARHPGIPRIAFIGSETTGRAIQASAAAVAVKDVSLELGGKNAMVVFPDADLEAAAQGAVKGMNLQASSGQSCGSTSRLLLHADIADQVEARVAELMAAIRLGLPLEPSTEMGPLVSAQQRGRVTELLDSGLAEGAGLLVGGGRPADLDRGHFVAPTLLTGVAPEMRIAREEVFGPVLSVLRFRDETEAMRLANAVDYGLTASVWTSDLLRAHRFAAAFEAGFVWVNGTSQHFAGVPYGGWKASGLGREESLDELLSFTRTKAVTIFGAGSALGG